MKFYEFDKDYDYYALIGAESIEQAKEYYNEAVSDIEDYENVGAMPEEISEEKARGLYEKTIGQEIKDKLKGVSKKVINMAITEAEKEIGFDVAVKESPCLLIIDGSLI